MRHAQKLKIQRQSGMLAFTQFEERPSTPSLFTLLASGRIVSSAPSRRVASGARPVASSALVTATTASAFTSAPAF
jgi:hypothetical protein